MYCTNCSSERPNDTSPCPSCGMPAMAMAMEPLQPPRQQIPNYLAQSILVTICCCMPFGIPAIVYSSQVNGKVQAGDTAGAIEASNKAKMWAWISFGLGALFGVLYLVGGLLTGFE